VAANYAKSSFWVALVLAAPSGLGASANVGGGTFAAATYFWKITGTNAAGETTGSNEATVAVALNGTASLTWSALPAGTTGTKVYRGTSAGAENVLVATLGAVVAYTDTGTAGSAATVPAGSSAVLANHFVLEGSLRDSASVVVAANPGQFSAAAPVTGQGHITGKLAQHLAAYAAGSEL
jgi:hypothetical protein